jgi:PKHD-type hydroxylase
MKGQPIIDVNLPVNKALDFDTNTTLENFGKRKTGDLLDYYWFRSEFSADQCSEIISLCKKLPKEEGTTFSSDPSIRKSSVRWLPPTTDSLWIFNAIKRLCLEANEIWNLDVDGFSEAIQFTEYEEVGSHYDYHMDISESKMGRKISVCVFLSDPTTFEGGDLAINCGGKDLVCPKDQGNVILFPSILQHKIYPITKGQRHSLVCWVGGPEWR